MANVELAVNNPNFPEYSKIDTLYERDPKTFIVDPSKLKKPVIGTINTWIATEKIDGTNIRVLFDGERVTLGGRSNAAQLPADLVSILGDLFTPELFRAAFTEDPVVLYGEGYGAGIQKAGIGYRKDKGFILFDVLVAGKWWLDWADVEDVARKMGIARVPSLGEMTLHKITDLCATGMTSLICPIESEGIVARPIQTLFDKRGERLIIKLKTKDFKPGKR